MGFSYYNPNPAGKSVGDCTVRAIAKALDRSWEETYTGLALKGFCLGDMPNADSVWGPYLRDHGWTRHLLSDDCPDCKLCDRLVISQAVTFAGGNLVINLPAGSYRNGAKYCIVVAQAIPDTATINAPVVVTIGTGTEQYPLTNRCCAQLTACAIRTRTRYAAVVSTSGTSGTFKLLGNACPCPTNNLPSINGTAPAAPTA